MDQKPKNFFEFERVTSCFAHFKLVGELCFVNNRCVGFTKIEIETPDKTAKLTRKWKAKINRKIKLDTVPRGCLGCSGRELVLPLFAGEEVREKPVLVLKVLPKEMCKFREVFKSWTEKRGEFWVYK